MISSFMLDNLTLNKSAKFGQNFDCEYIYESGGLDWGNIPATHHIYSYPRQIGSSFSSTKINEREITIEAYAYYAITEDDKHLYPRKQWASYGYAKIKEKKKKLNELINPLHVLRLTIGNYYIEGRPNATPQYGTTEQDNNLFFCKFLVTIFCANPMFRKLTETVTVLSGNVGAFHFPLEFPPYGIIMGTRTSYLMLAVQNEGDVEVGGKIIITAKGTVVNPTIENVTTGQQLTIRKTLSAGETVIINTEDGSERGVIGEYQGVRSNYLQYWDFNNDWVKFEAGTSLIGYSTESQTENYMEVTIQINPSRFGLEDM